jgi:hypothetical protein
MLQQLILGSWPLANPTGFTPQPLSILLQSIMGTPGNFQ